MVIHLQDAAATGRAVMRTIRFASLAFLAETSRSRRLYGEGWEVGVLCRVVCQEVRVTRSGRTGGEAIEGRARVGEDSSSIRPVQKSVGGDSESHGDIACHRHTVLVVTTIPTRGGCYCTLPRGRCPDPAEAVLHINSPCGQTIHEGERQVSDNGPAASLTLPRNASLMTHR